MSFLWVTIPVSLGLGLVLLVFVIRAARAGDFEDWEGPAFRMLFDDDSAPELERAVDPDTAETSAPAHPPGADGSWPP